MDVISDFAATLWKMFAGDLALSIGALAVVALTAVLSAGRVIGNGIAPLLLAALLLGVFTIAVRRAAKTEFLKRTKR